MELYEKEGVSLTGGCLPMIVQMVVLFGIISVIYKPLTHLQKIPSAVIDTAIVTVTNPVDENGNDILTPNKITQADANPNSYYRELRMLKVLSANQGEVVAAIDAMDPAQRGRVVGRGLLRADAGYPAQFRFLWPDYAGQSLFGIRRYQYPVADPADFPA